MFGLKERPYPAHVLISFWCDSDNEKKKIFTLQNFNTIFLAVLFILAIFKIW